jgi:arsenate reductase
MSAAFDPDRLVAQLAALAQPSRLAVVRLLARYRPFGLPAGDIARLVGVPHNTMSTHLAQLEAAGLLRSRREGRMVIFVADAGVCAGLAATLGESLDPAAKRGLREPALPVLAPEPGEGCPYTVLVLCTANSARSLMAEALINREGRGRFRAFSAGSQPGAGPHPEALRLLASLGYDTGGLHSKSWRRFSEGQAERVDFAITVCDAAAEAPCPTWPGHPLAAHWGVADPALASTPEEQRAAMLLAYRQLAARVTSLVTLPVERMDLASLQRALADIARLEGATPLALTRAAA